MKSKGALGRSYVLRGLITCLCGNTGVPDELLDYITPLTMDLFDITKMKGVDASYGLTRTLVKQDELIMAHIYRIEML